MELRITQLKTSSTIWRDNFSSNLNTDERNTPKMNKIKVLVIKRKKKLSLVRTSEHQKTDLNRI